MICYCPSTFFNVAAYHTVYTLVQIRSLSFNQLRQLCIEKMTHYFFDICSKKTACQGRPRRKSQILLYGLSESPTTFLSSVENHETAAGYVMFSKSKLSRQSLTAQKAWTTADDREEWKASRSCADYAF